MTSPLDGFDGAADHAPLPPELEALIERIETDAVLWEAHAPADDGRLGEYARQVAGGVLEALRPAAAGVALANPPVVVPSAVPPTVQARSRTQASAYVATLVVMVLLASLFTYLSVRPRGATTTPTPVATASATATRTGVPTATATTQPTATATVASSGGAGAGIGAFPVARAQANASPTEWTNSLCGATVPFTLSATFWFASGAPGGTVTYRWLRSDGYVGPAQQVSYSAGKVAVTDPVTAEWDVPAASADGTDKWAAVEVLSPNATTSAHVTLNATCQFTVESATVTVTGGNGGNPPNYDCKAGGDQTFTAAGTIAVSGAPGSHTIQYHWLLSQDSGSTSSQEYSVTAEPGATSVDVQPDTFVIYASDPLGNRLVQVMLDSPSAMSSNVISIFKGC